MFVKRNGPSSATIATTQMATGVRPEADDETVQADVVVAALAYQRCLTELACWALVLKGELMLKVSPAWVDGDQHRQVQFTTIDRRPVVIDTSVM